MVMGKVYYYIIPLVVLILFALWISGSMSGSKGLVEGIVKGAEDALDLYYLPEAKLGKDELNATKVIVPEEHKKAIIKLVETIEKMTKVTKVSRTNCFMNYKLKNYGTSGLPDLMNTRISLGKDSVFAYVRDQQDIALNKQLQGKLKDFKPCVIAGETADKKSIPQNFHTIVLKKDIFGRGGQEYYSDLTSQNLILFYDDGVLSKNNKIMYNKNKGVDIEDGGWLFKTNKGQVCFFPTVDSEDAGAHDTRLISDSKIGLETGCLGAADEYDLTSIPQGLVEGRLQYCDGYTKDIKYWWVEVVGDGSKPVAQGSPIRGRCLEGVSCPTYQRTCTSMKLTRDKGCSIIATDTSKNHCAAGEARVGSLISYSNNQQTYTKIQTDLGSVLSKPADRLNDKNQAKFLLEKEGFRWYIPNNQYPLVCGKDKYWHECNELTAKEAPLQLERRFGNDDPTVKDLKVKCVKQSGTEKYDWELVN